MSRWGGFLALFFGAWSIDYFQKKSYINFPICFLIISILVILNIIYIIHLEFEDKQQLNDKCLELSSKNQSLKEENQNLKPSSNNYPSKEEFDNLKIKTNKLEKKVTSIIQTQSVTALKASSVDHNKLEEKQVGETKYSIILGLDKKDTIKRQNNERGRTNDS